MFEVKTLLLLLIGLVIMFGFINIFHLILIDNDLEKLLENKKRTNKKEKYKDEL